MTANTFRAIGILALLTTQACIKDFRNGRPDLVQPTKVGNAAPSRDRTGSAIKAVYAKEPPTFLVARDGTSCVVSQQKYDSATLGSSVSCTWFDANR